MSQAMSVTGTRGLRDIYQIARQEGADEVVWTVQSIIFVHSNSVHGNLDVDVLRAPYTRHCNNDTDDSLPGA